MATPQAKLKIETPKPARKRAVYLPVRVPPEGLSDFFLELNVGMEDEAFKRFCESNSELRIERRADGVIEIMPPAKSVTGARNSKLTSQLDNWADEEGSGVVFDSSAGFKLPNGATRAPDASWVRYERMAHLSPEEQDDWLPLCPDFVLELRSKSDRLPRLREKMEEYIANGAQLGWLIDPQERKVYVYRPNTEVDVLDSPAELVGDPILPGFVLRLRKIWKSNFLQKDS